MTTETKEMNLWQKLNAITERVESIPKNGFNERQNYNYVRAVDVLESIRKLLVEFRVVCLVKEDDLQRDQISEKGFATRLKCTATLVNIDNPDEKIELPFHGVAHDHGDKDLYKAKTSGLKYLFIETFKIPSDLVDVEDEGKAVTTNSEKINRLKSFSERKAATAPRQESDPNVAQEEETNPKDVRVQTAAQAPIPEGEGSKIGRFTRRRRTT